MSSDSLLHKRQNISQVIIIAGLIYTFINVLAFYSEVYWLLLVPVFLGLFYLYFFHLDIVLLLVAFTTPISIEVFDIGIGGLGVSFPTEPLMVGAMLFYFLKLLLENKWDRAFIFHPITLLIVAQLIWIFFTSITSTLPIVSFKFFLARLWFVTSFYFLGYYLFGRRERRYFFLWLFILSLTVVALYSVIRLHQYSYNDKAAHWVMEPFFRDHTSYGAVLALLFPFVVMFFLRKQQGVAVKIFLLFLLFIHAVAIVLSYTRAAWISLLAGLVVFLIFKWKISTRVVFLSIISLSVLIGSSYHTLLQKLEKNRQDSSSDLAEHVQSISNISSDASNLERLNRWAAAYRMFLEKPWTGWGPGTYQFVYAPFQMSYQKTIISTNAGDAGNAHSEYIGPLCEQGVPGLLLVIALIVAVYYYGRRYYLQEKDNENKNLMITCLVSLTTYFVHGLLNNYLDLDKASVPFWGIIAMIVALCTEHKTEESRKWY